MPKMILTVFSDPISPERQDEYDDWYANIHVPDVCAIPGVLSARRFREATQASAFAGEVAGGRRNMVIYEIDTDNPAEVEAEMQARLADGRLRSTDTLQNDPPPIARYYEQTSPA